MVRIIVFIFLITSLSATAQKVAILKYNGGGDWYANPTALPNLIAFSNTRNQTNIKVKPETVEVGSKELFNYPIVFMTGHGNVIFSDADAENLRTYLISGGFLHISDNYGLDKFIRREFKKVFPLLSFKEIPSNHEVFRQPYSFPNGVPKIHEHDKKPPQAFGIFYKDRLICFYDYESDLSDGWEDEEIHKNPEQLRQRALKMGVNILYIAFKN